MANRAAPAAWHYIFDGAESGDGGVADGWRQRDAGCTEREAGGGMRRGANDEAFAVVLDFGLGQGIRIGDDRRPGAHAAERDDAILQRFLQHQREEAAEHVAADGIGLVESRCLAVRKVCSTVHSCL